MLQIIWYATLHNKNIILKCNVTMLAFIVMVFKIPEYWLVILLSKNLWAAGRNKTINSMKSVDVVINNIYDKNIANSQIVDSMDNI